MGVTGTQAQLFERELNIMCISLKFLYTSTWNLLMVYLSTHKSVYMSYGANFRIFYIRALYVKIKKTTKLKKFYILILTSQWTAWLSSYKCFVKPGVFGQIYENLHQRKFPAIWYVYFSLSLFSLHTVIRRRGYVYVTPCLVLSVPDAVCDVFTTICTVKANRVDSSLMELIGVVILMQSHTIHKWVHGIDLGNFVPILNS